MSKVKVLFFAADPFSAPPDGRAARLGLDEDIRQIRAKIRGAEYRDALEFDFRLAARTDDLLQALNETRPQVVHFSGHGGKDGLVLVSSDGLRPHSVGAAALGQLFDVFRGDIHVAVLNACFSLPQAQAIAEAVGCAIGTHGQISDGAAITFGASFYRALAFGNSVKAAYDQASAALALEHFEDRECPRLVARAGVDPDKLVLVSSRGMGPVGMTIAGLALAGVAAFTAVTLADRGDHAPTLLHADSAAADSSPPAADTSSPVRAAAQAQEPEKTPSDDRSRRRNPAPREADDGAPPAEAPQGTVSAPIIGPTLETESSLPIFGDTAPNPTMRPAHPR